MTHNTRISFLPVYAPSDSNESLLTEVECQCRKFYQFMSQDDIERDPCIYSNVTFICECGNKIKLHFPAGEL